jgi:hypothetical protein
MCPNYICIYIYLFISFYLHHYLMSLNHPDNLPISNHRKIWILYSVEWWEKMHDVRMNLNPSLPRQKQHSTRWPFDQNLGVKFKDKTSTFDFKILKHGIVWCGKLDSSENKKCLERFEMWCCRRIDVISWTVPLKNEDVIQRIAENMNILHIINQNKSN